MLSIRSLFFILPYFLCRSSGAIIAGTTPQVTPTSAISDIPVSIETPPPALELKARDRAGGLCGYYHGDAASPYICYSGFSCVQDHDYNAIGCVQTNTKKQLLGVVYTTCLNYDVYQKYSVGPRTGCCTDPDYPACVWNTYTGEEAEGYTLIQCTQTYFQPGRFLAWDASTSGTAGPTTLFIGVQTATNNNTIAAPTTSPPAPSNTPTGLSTSDKITLGTALGLGLPATIAGVIGTWYAYKSWKNKKNKPQDDERPFLPGRKLTEQSTFST